MSTHRIIVVDDDPVVHGLIVGAMPEIEVVSALTFEQGQRALADLTSVDAVLLDVALPDGSGFSLLAGLVDRGGGQPAVPVAMISATEPSAAIASSIPYLVKPVDDVVLRRTIAGLVSGA